MKNVDFVRGATTAANVAAEYNATSTHEYRLDDCILGKLNLRKGHPRLNKTRVAAACKSHPKNSKYKMSAFIISAEHSIYWCSRCGALGDAELLTRNIRWRLPSRGA